MKNYYAILKVPAGASLEEIRQAYHRLTQEYLDDDQAFADLKEAFEVLTSPAGREAYDRTLVGEAAIPAISRAGTSRCPLNAGAQCPVLSARVTAADTFCPECGYLLSALSEGAAFEDSFGADPALTARLEAADGSVYLLKPGVNVVGRESADVLLSDKTVSRQHARFELSDNGMVILEDLGSTNGTQVNEVSLVPPVQRRVVSQDRLRFGSVVTVLHLPEVATQNGQTSLPTEIPTSEIPMTEMPILLSELPTVPVPPAQVVDIREGFGQIYPLLPTETTFGRRAENTVVLTGDQYVSGRHARIMFLENQYILTDVGSTNGTLLNGNRLATNTLTPLTHGDVILIGAAALRFEIIGMPLEDEIVEELEEDESDEELGDEEPGEQEADTTANAASTPPAPAILEG